MKHALKLLPVTLLALSFGAQADIAITIKQVGKDVVVEGSGSLSTENLTCFPIGNQNEVSSFSSKDANTATFGMQLQPLTMLFANSPIGSLPESASMCLYSITTREGVGLGSSEEVATGISSGSLFGLNEFEYENEFAPLAVLLSNSYTSGSRLIFSGLIADKTLNELGLTAGGSLKWTLSTEPIEAPNEENPPALRKAGDVEILSITVQGEAVPPTATPVPTLGIFGLMGLASAIGAAGVAMNRRRKQ